MTKLRNIFCVKGHNYEPLDEAYRKGESIIGEIARYFNERYYRMLFCTRCGETKEVVSRIIAN